MDAELYKLFHGQLAHCLVAMDKAEERAEIRRGRGTNIYRMGLLLKAMHEAEEEAKQLVAEGVPVKEAFIQSVTAHFTATRRMHTFLKKIDPTIDVQRGRWVRRG